MTHPQVTLAEEGILHIDFGGLHNISLEAAEAAHRRHLELTEQRLPVLLEALEPLRLDPQAARFASCPEVCGRVTAMAILVRSAWALNLAKIFLFYHRPPYPTRLFTERDEALAWLQAYMETAPEPA